MNSKPEHEQIITLVEVLAAIGLIALLLALGSLAHAQQQPASVNFDPPALEKARAELFLKSSHSELSELENDLNHLAVLSETCRAEFGTKTCGLDSKELSSDKLEDRFSYYVRQPLQVHSSGHPVKINKHSWEDSNAPASH